MKNNDITLETKQGNIVVDANAGLQINNNIARLIDTRWVSENTYVLRLEKKNFDFEPGQYVTVGLPDKNQNREYSIYSGVNDPYLEVIIREVEDGFLSLKLKKVKVGDLLLVDGPFGFFNIDEQERKSKKYLFIATGTGISPFHSMVASYPDLDYTLLHGVRNASEAYERDFYDAKRHILCTSRDDKGNYRGRVTDYLKANTIDNSTLVYLCGNSEMIYDVYDILMAQGMSSDNIRTEVYF